MDMRALKVRAEDHGCNTCGARGTVFYAVMFYILPARLKRKRHKERQQLAIYCQSCYETAQEIPYLVDGNRYVASTAGLRENHAVGEPGEPPPALECGLCGSPFSHWCLYGILSSTLFKNDSIVEEKMLTLFCETCIESHRISLIAKLTE